MIAGLSRYDCGESKVVVVDSENFDNFAGSRGFNNKDVLKRVLEGRVTRIGSFVINSFLISDFSVSRGASDFDPQQLMRGQRELRERMQLNVRHAELKVQLIEWREVSRCASSAAYDLSEIQR